MQVTLLFHYMVSLTMVYGLWFLYRTSFQRDYRPTNITGGAPPWRINLGWKPWPGRRISKVPGTRYGQWYRKWGVQPLELDWKKNNVGIAIINNPFLMIYTTHLRWLGRWFIIAIPTLDWKRCEILGSTSDVAWWSQSPAVYPKTWGCLTYLPQTRQVVQQKQHLPQQEYQQ